MKKFHHIFFFVALLFVGSVLFSSMVIANGEEVASQIEQGQVSDYSQIPTQDMVEALRMHPELASKLPDADFIRALNSDPSLMESTVFMTDVGIPNGVFFELNERVKKDPTILNQNVDVKRKWFSVYGIADDDKSGGAVIEQYDGTRVRTGGTNGMTFDVASFPGAKVLRDGSLVFQDKTFSGCKSLITSKEDGHDVIYMESGEVVVPESKGLGKASYSLVVSETGTAVVKHKDNGRDVTQVNYIGGVTLEGSSIGLLVTPLGKSFRRDVDGGDVGFSSSEIFGRILEPKKAKSGEFIMLGSGKIVGDDGGNVVEITGSSKNSKTYYTEEPSRSAGTFCKKDGACVVNTPVPGDVLVRSRLAISGVKAGNSVRVRSSSYYFNAEFENIEGDAYFDSYPYDLGTGTWGASKSSIHVHQGDVGVQGVLRDSFAGRVDVVVPKDSSCSGSNCPTLLKHWSSDGFQKDLTRQYFSTPNDHFVTCERGVNCLSLLAQNFGKLVGPPSKPISKVIIVGGDNAGVAQSIQQGDCRVERCAIIHSRDVPPEIDSTVTSMVITGHHDEAADSIWHDAPNMGAGHNARDRIYFGRVPAGSNFDSLPNAPNVKTVSFSACNSVLPPSYEYPGMQSLLSRYPKVVIFQGWTGKASLHESLSSTITSASQIPSRVAVNRNWDYGHRAFLVKNEDGKWIYWDGMGEKQEYTAHPKVASTGPGMGPG